MNAIMSGMLQGVVPLIIACFLNVSGLATFETYEDVVVVRLDEEKFFQNNFFGGFAYGGFIFAKYEVDNGKVNDDIYPILLKHEYGHVLQQRKYCSKYLYLVAIPSLLSSLSDQHGNFPWEVEANLLSGFNNEEISEILTREKEWQIGSRY